MTMEIVKVVALTGSDCQTADEIVSTVPKDVAPKVQEYFDKAGFDTIHKFSKDLTCHDVVKKLFQNVTEEEKKKIRRLYTPSCSNTVSEIAHGHFWADIAGLGNVPVVNVTDGCNGSLTCLELAYDAMHRFDEGDMVAILCCEFNVYENNDHPIDNSKKRLTKDTMFWAFSSLTVGSAASLTLIRKASSNSSAAWKWDTVVDNSASKECYATLTPFCDKWLPNIDKSLPRDESVFYCNHRALIKTFVRLFKDLYKRTNGGIIRDAKAADYVLVHSNSVSMWEAILKPFGVKVTDHVAADIGNIQTATLWVALARTLTKKSNSTNSGIKKVMYLGVASGASVTAMQFSIDLGQVQAYYLPKEGDPSIMEESIPFGKMKKDRDIPFTHDTAKGAKQVIGRHQRNGMAAAATAALCGVFVMAITAAATTTS